MNSGDNYLDMYREVSSIASYGGRFQCLARATQN